MPNDVTTDFSVCPTCADADTSAGCVTCHGNGQRPLTEQNVQLALSGKEWLDSAISALFGDWCEAFKIRRAYGVESYQITAKTVEIVQDISAKGCHNTMDWTIPLRYLYLGAADRCATMADDYATQAKKQAEALRQSKLVEAARLKAVAARLEAEASPPAPVVPPRP